MRQAGKPAQPADRNVYVTGQRRSSGGWISGAIASAMVADQPIIRISKSNGAVEAGGLISHQWLLMVTDSY
jgi:hypothetical protein